MRGIMKQEKKMEYGNDSAHWITASHLDGI